MTQADSVYGDHLENRPGEKIERTSDRKRGPIQINLFHGLPCDVQVILTDLQYSLKGDSLGIDSALASGEAAEVWQWSHAISVIRRFLFAEEPKKQNLWDSPQKVSSVRSHLGYEALRTSSVHHERSWCQCLSYILILSSSQLIQVRSHRKVVLGGRKTGLVYFTQ